MQQRRAESGGSTYAFSGQRAGRLLGMALLAIVLLTAPAGAQAAESKFLWISDIHFNPMADPALVSELEKAAPEEWEAILNRTAPASFSQYNSDTNWWLLKSALEQFPKTLRHPAFVMVTGDLLAHSFPKLFQGATHDNDQQHYRSFVLKTVEFLGLELQRRFPRAKILVTPGNNDNDCGDYTIQANGAFLNDTAPVVRDLAGADDALTANWKALGSFNVAHPTIANARILSLNSVFWSQKYRALSSEQGCRPVASSAPGDLMKWLEENLEAAAQAHQKVWLMFHIPPGIDGYATGTAKVPTQAAQERPLEWGTQDQACSQSIVPMWATQWTAQFDALLTKYSDTVVAGFAAHTHSDDFRVIEAKGTRRGFVVMSPAISPVYGQNPSYRVVSYKGNGALADQSTYYLTNLKEASATTKGVWKKEYTFAREWKVRGLDAASLSLLYGQIVASDRVRAEWLKLYAVSGPALEGEKPIVRALYCAVEGLSVEEYKRCYCGAKP
jgi:sphingomyelin phosphodiesterase acid-like 3